MFDDIWDFVKFMCGFSVLFFGLLFFLCLPMVYMDKAACEQKGEHYGLETTYKFPTGCLFSREGEAIPSHLVEVTIKE